MKRIAEVKVAYTLLALGLLLTSPLAMAAVETSWKTYLLIVMGISLVFASILSLRNSKAESRMAKLLLTGLYFWVFTFAQLMILSLIYYLNK